MVRKAVTDKSYCAVRTAVCFICANENGEESELLLDPRLRDSLDRQYYTMASEPCNVCREKLADDYVALIEVDESKLPDGFDVEAATGEQVWPYRTGKTYFLRMSVYEDLTDVPVGKDRIAYVDKEAGTKLKDMIAAIQAKLDEEEAEAEDKDKD